MAEVEGILFDVGQEKFFVSSSLPKMSFPQLAQVATVGLHTLVSVCREIELFTFDLLQHIFNWQQREIWLVNIRKSLADRTLNSFIVQPNHFPHIPFLVRLSLLCG